MTIKPAHLNGLLVTLIGVVLIPGMIVIASLILGMANESAGWLRYRLPEVFFWIFLSTGIASPFLGIGALVFLWILQRRPALVDGGKTDPRMKPTLILAAAITIFAPVGRLCSAKSSSWQAGTARGRTGLRTNSLGKIVVYLLDLALF